MSRSGRASVVALGFALGSGSQALAQPASSLAEPLFLGGDGAPLAPERAGRFVLHPPGLGASDDGVRFGLRAGVDRLPARITLATRDAEGQPLDRLADLALFEIACPDGGSPDLACAATDASVVLVADEQERRHPAWELRSIVGRAGGELVAFDADGMGGELFAVPVGAPLLRRAELRVRLVRPVADGPPPVGRSDVDALAQVGTQVDQANQIWGACGIQFDAVDIQIVPPPPPFVLGIGCDYGYPSSGGTIALVLEGSPVEVEVPPRRTPVEIARLVAAAIAERGFEVRIRDNASMAAGVHPTADLLVYDEAGRPVAIERPEARPLSDDPTLPACISELPLWRGLRHFSDVDASAGTIEERTLLHGVTDLDPATVDVVWIPAFAHGGRVGESFIVADGGALQNALVMGRAALRANKASMGLAHELGHVLLDEPGHPDDYGVDEPWALMDADASDPTVFGPRRLSEEECVRAWAQSSGLGVRVLEPVPR